MRLAQDDNNPPPMTPGLGFEGVCSCRKCTGRIKFHTPEACRSNGGTSASLGPGKCNFMLERRSVSVRHIMHILRANKSDIESGSKLATTGGGRSGRLTGTCSPRVLCQRSPNPNINYHPILISLLIDEPENVPESDAR